MIARSNTSRERAALKRSRLVTLALVVAPPL
jgi:hypothetical protein